MMQLENFIIYHLIEAKAELNPNDLSHKAEEFDDYVTIHIDHSIR